MRLEDKPVYKNVEPVRGSGSFRTITRFHGARTNGPSRQTAAEAAEDADKALIFLRPDVNPVLSLNIYTCCGRTTDEAKEIYETWKTEVATSIWQVNTD